MNRNQNPIQLKFSCGQDWNTMTPVEDGRHCHECRKTVYDFTDSKPDEFRKILAEHGYQVCGRFNAEDVSVKKALPLWKRWASAALLLLGPDLWSCNDIGEVALGKRDFNAQGEQEVVTTMGIPIIHPPVTSGFGLRYIRFAVAEQPTEFPGGSDAFSRYVSKHVRLKHNFSGEVRARFIVKRNGRIREVEITKGGDRVINKAIIRIIKHSPRWKAARANGRNVNQEVIIPVVIK